MLEFTASVRACRCWVCLQGIHQRFSELGQFFIHPVKARMAIEEGYIPTICTCGQKFRFSLWRNRKALERFKRYILDHVGENEVIEDYICHGYYVRRGTMDDDTVSSKKS